SIRFLQVNEISAEALNVSIEDDPDKVSVAIDHWGSRIATDDVCRQHEVERSRHIDFAFPLDEPWHEIKRRFVVEAGGSVVQAVERRFRRSLCPIHWISLHGAVSQSQRECRVRIDRLAVDCETGFRNFFRSRCNYRLDIILVLLSDLAKEGIYF